MTSSATESPIGARLRSWLRRSILAWTAAYCRGRLDTMAKQIISLFSGALGLDLGLEKAGLKIAVAVEKNGTAVETIKLNRDSELPVIDHRIEDVSATQILRKARLRKKEAF